MVWPLQTHYIEVDSYFDSALAFREEKIKQAKKHLFKNAVNHIIRHTQ